MEALKDYLKKVEEALSTGRATEHTYRSILESLIEALVAGVRAINEPKRIACGAPDLIVMRGETPLGYIEAKDVGESLDRAEASEQLKRYLEGLGNLILTDYLEFRWYVRGEHRLTARLAKKGKGVKLRVEKDGQEEVEQLLKAFLSAEAPTVGSAKELAERMAAIAQLIRDTIRRALDAENLTDERADPLHEQMKGFREVLLHDLTGEQFADMYAQTICYGLFAARCNVRGGASFTREQAAFRLPKTNPFLRKMFTHIAGPELDERIAWAVDDLADLLNHTDIAAILKDFGKRTRREDPVVHFYETFLAAYDPKLRETRGVYYTPEPVVSYIVRSVDHILRTDFKLKDGLADASRIRVKQGKEVREVHRVLVLDPATGTGTFLYAVINQIFDSFKHNRGMWSSYVSEHLLPRLFGFELMMAPYTVAHMKLDLLLDETGYNFHADERLRVYLTNTLEEAHAAINLPLFAQEIAAEANEASRIKQEAPVMVIVGNPPYSGNSANVGEWISGLLRGRDTITGKATENYFEVDGGPLGERNPKWLNDDYVKFMRFAQWRIEQTGYGVLAFITNHGYLDNPTFRGMRQSLMETFDDIYVLDLHGNSKKKERAPDGSEDKNVFDIQQGVAIGIFIERANGKKKAVTVHHAHLWGLREIYEEEEQGERELTGGKYHWLWQHDVSTTKWTTLEPQSPFYLFVPQDTTHLEEYDVGWKITEAMPVNNTGLITSRDKFVFGFTQVEVLSRIRDFALSGPEYGRDYGLRDVRERTLEESYKLIRALPSLERHMVRCLYRPFDIRWLFYHHALVRWPVYDVMNQMLIGENLGLVTSRMTKGETFHHAQVTRNIVEVICMSSKTSNNGFLFPLYIYPAVEMRAHLFDMNSNSDAPGGRRPNLAPAFVAEMAGRIGMEFVEDGKGDLEKTFGPEDVFHYMYAVFHSPEYRRRYAEFLKIDFPRLPLTSNAELFRALCALGEELTGLHLMERDAPSVAGFPQPGDNTVEAVRYTAPDTGAPQGRVWINREQYFENVPEEVWNFHVGGYQVCQKWLKDRKGRKLTYDDLTHYRRIIAALAATMRLMTRVDEAISAHGGWPLA